MKFGYGVCTLLRQYTKRGYVEHYSAETLSVHNTQKIYLIHSRFFDRLRKA